MHSINPCESILFFFKSDTTAKERGCELIERMFLLTLALFIAVLDAMPCDYATGHGIVIVSDSSCQHFMGHHLGEFECPHQYDVKIEFTFKHTADQLKYCKLQTANHSAMFTIAPELVLTSFR